MCDNLFAVIVFSNELYASTVSMDPRVVIEQKKKKSLGSNFYLFICIDVTTGGGEGREG